MRIFIFLLLLLPLCGISQDPAIMIDTIGNTGRINFVGPLSTIQIGQDAGNAISTGLDNVYIGLLSGSTNTTGFNNISIGSHAGERNTTGSSNVNIGPFAGYFTSTGFGNVNIGDTAGAIDATGNNNVRVGYLAGGNAIGSRNVLIGFNSGYALQGDDQLRITNTFNKPALISGDFAKDSLTINGDLNVTGDMIVGSIDVAAITGILGNGYSAVFPVVLDNTVEIEILGITNVFDVLVTSTIGFELDTFMVDPSCSGRNTGMNAEYPLVFETDNAAEIAELNNWFANPSAESINIAIQDVSGTDQFVYNLYNYKPGSTTAGSDGRTSYTLVQSDAPNNTLLVEQINDFGFSFSYNPQTDKLVDIAGISHMSFTPAVEVDYAKRVITLEMTYNEGEGIYDWIKDFATGLHDIRSMSIIETTDGMTETSRENFYEVAPFQYEIIYGFGLYTKLRARVKLLYGCNEPG